MVSASILIVEIKGKFHDFDDVSHGINKLNLHEFALRDGGINKFGESLN